MRHETDSKIGLFGVGWDERRFQRGCKHHRPLDLCRAPVSPVEAIQTIEGERRIMKFF